MKAEKLARLLLITLVVGLLGAVAAARRLERREYIELHGQMAETGGWTPDVINAQAGKPLLLRIASDDVMHGFAVGRFGPAGCGYRTRRSG